MWIKLHGVFDFQDTVGKQNLMQQDKNDDMSTHLSKIEFLIYQLRAFDITMDTAMINSKILTTLPDEFKYFICAWESLDVSLQTTENLANRLIIEEKRQKGSNFDVGEAFVMRKDRNFQEGKNGARKFKGNCFICGERGHWKEQCSK